MAKDNTWKTVAEVYRNRENTLIQLLQDFVEGKCEGRQLVDRFTQHMLSTGRTPDRTPELFKIDSPVDSAKTELLALLGATVGQQSASKPRKQRADKGKPRGSYKAKRQQEMVA